VIRRAPFSDGQRCTMRGAMRFRTVEGIKELHGASRADQVGDD
jgi:hypothetical protein